MDADIVVLLGAAGCAGGAQSPHALAQLAGMGEADLVTINAASASDRGNAGQQPMRYNVLSPIAIAGWAVLIVAVGVGMVAWLLLGFTSGDVETNRVKLEAIRTAGTVVVGTGGAAALLLAARRQRTAEIALKQKDRDHADVGRAFALQERVAAETKAHQERVASATEADAAARRITDLYTKAIEQLGSDRAPVRLGGLYALERLAQDNPTQRQTIVNVFCAYLRMPYIVDDDSDTENVAEGSVPVHSERAQEREVRQTAQRIVADHLRPGDMETPAATFWTNITLDLTGATLIDFDLSRCTVTGRATFNSAKFIGNTSFWSTTFKVFARFANATFAGRADFGSAYFAADASFESTSFIEGTDAGAAAHGLVVPNTDFRLARFGRWAPDEIARFRTPQSIVTQTGADPTTSPAELGD